MAISHVHLILLSLLFFLPTLRATTVPFERCGRNSDPVTVTSVEILQDKFEASLKISGSTSQTLNKGGSMNVVVTVSDSMPPIFSETLDLCAHMDCPVAPGAFVLSFDKFLPFGLKFHFHIVAFDDLEEPIMCLIFDVPMLNVPLPSLLNQVAG